MKAWRRSGLIALQILNSFTVAMLDELLIALDRVRDDDRIRALLITGNGRGFSAGIDLAEGGVTPGSGDADRILETHLNPIMERLMALPVPVVNDEAFMSEATAIAARLAKGRHVRWPWSARRYGHRWKAV